MIAGACAGCRVFHSRSLFSMTFPVRSCSFSCSTGILACAQGLPTREHTQECLCYVPVLCFHRHSRFVPAILVVAQARVPVLPLPNRAYANFVGYQLSVGLSKQRCGGRYPARKVEWATSRWSVATTQPACFPMEGLGQARLRVARRVECQQAQARVPRATTLKNACAGNIIC